MKTPRSAYLHIPFCYKRCFYCDFTIIPLGKNNKPREKDRSIIENYLNLIHKEISLSPKGSPLSTIYIGGGTPSLLAPKEISSLIEKLDNVFGIQDGAEITLEVDPSTFSNDFLEKLIDVGINRISLGGQSFDDQVLCELGRTHTSEQLQKSCQQLDEKLCNGEICSWSLDLIQNLPKQNSISWEHQLKNAISTNAPHLSIYDLSIEPGTVFEALRNRGKLDLPSEEIAYEINALTNQVLIDAGFSRYEISSFAMPCHSSRHNRMYWSGSGWWGYGMGATSAPWGKRLTRPKTMRTYEDWINDQENNGIHSSLLNINSQNIPLDELLITGLRRREGVDLIALAKSSGWNNLECDKYLKLLKNRWRKYLDSGLLISQGDRFFLSNPEGMALSNQILVEMLIWWDSLPNDAVPLSTPLALQ